MTGTRRTAAQRLGDDAEAAAERWLRKRGLQPLERNWRCRLGELDLVMRDGALLVFVEVRRRRRGHRFADAAESVGPRKQARLVRAATVYLQRWKDPPPCRFDVVAFDVGEDGQARPRWIRDAFAPA